MKKLIIFIYILIINEIICYNNKLNIDKAEKEYNNTIGIEQKFIFIKLKKEYFKGIYLLTKIDIKLIGYYLQYFLLTNHINAQSFVADSTSLVIVCRQNSAIDINILKKTFVQIENIVIKNNNSKVDL